MGEIYSIALTPDQIKLLAYVKEHCLLFSPKHEYSGKPVSCGWTASKLTRVARSLYGILGLTEDHFYSYRTHRQVIGYSEFFIPRQNYDAVDVALKCGRFEKEVEPDDIRVLRTIYERNAELRVNGSRWNPRFHISEISRRGKIRKKHAMESIGRLTGVVAETHFQEPVATRNFKVRKTRWFLPTSRFQDAERVLELYH